MFIENDIYKVSIYKDETFTIDSTDSKSYDSILNPLNMKRSDYYQAISINIETTSNRRSLVLIGSIYGADEGIAILEDAVLIVLMNTRLTVIDCESLAIKTSNDISEFGTYFSLYRFYDGYIVYGELDIIKLSLELEPEWSFFGADIFVSSDGRCPFNIKGDTINLIDWNGTEYTIDKFGKQLK